MWDILFWIYILGCAGCLRWIWNDYDELRNTRNPILGDLGLTGAVMAWPAALAASIVGFIRGAKRR